MKRSEAIKIISHYIYELNVEPEDCDKEADLILKALEKAGMLPPKDETDKQGYYGETFHKWEEEHE